MESWFLSLCQARCPSSPVESKPGAVPHTLRYVAKTPSIVFPKQVMCSKLARDKAGGLVDGPRLAGYFVMHVLLP